MTPTWKLLPPMGALRAFVAAARHASFTQAAVELNLTQGAISRQIRSLETLVGETLFVRANGRITLTDAGQSYLPDVSAALDRIGAATLGLLSYQAHGGAVDLAILPTFGHRWLVPRLAAFSHGNPGIMLNLATRSHPFDIEREPIDLAVHFGHDDWTGTKAVRLMGEIVAPVCSPAAFASFRKTSIVENMRDLGVLHLASRPDAWRDWFAAAGHSDVAVPAGPVLEQFSLLAQAAVAGLGAAIVPLFLFEEELAAGKLVQLPGPAIRSREAYYLVWPERRPSRPGARVFMRWLVEEARRFDTAAATTPPIRADPS